MASGPPSSILPEGWTWSDVGHGLLDVAGLVPVIGEPADLANAAWLAQEEKYLDAGLSLISLVPIVGDAIGKGGKIAKAAGGKLTGKALKAVREMDFAKTLAPLRKNPKLAPYVDKIVDALEGWRKELTGGLPKSAPGGCAACDRAASKTLGEAGTVVSKTPVPTRILSTLNDAQRKVFKEAVERVEKMTPPGVDRAVFYSGKLDGDYAYKTAEALAEKGKFDSVNTLTDNLLNAGGIRDLLPPEAMNFVDRLASKRLAETASGAVNFIGEVETITKGSVFRTIELPALLKNPAIDAASRARLEQMKAILDKMHGHL